MRGVRGERDDTTIQAVWFLRCGEEVGGHGGRVDQLSGVVLVREGQQMERRWRSLHANAMG